MTLTGTQDLWDRLLRFRRRHGVLRLPGAVLRAAWRRLFQNRHHVYVCTALPDDAECRLTLDIAPFSSEPDIPPDLLRQLRREEGELFVRTMRKEFSQHGELWLATVSGEVVAYQWTRLGKHIPKWFVELDEWDTVIFNGATLPRFRGRGIAPAMTTHIARQCLQAGGSAYLDCKVWNAPANRAFQKPGFRRIATRPPFEANDRSARETAAAPRYSS